jgi:nucleotide-binding universal stress UspA family protein
MVGGPRKQNVPGSNGPGPLRQILVAIDGSDSSLRAMAMAAEMAKPFDAKLVVISVASPPEYALMDYYRGGASPSVMELMRKAAEDQAHAALERAQEVAKRRGVEVETLMDWGPVKETLLHAVTKYHPDMLVVGSRGLSRFKKLLLGSVSEAMIRYADCPVFVMK